MIRALKGRHQFQRPAGNSRFDATGPSTAIEDGSSAMIYVSLTMRSGGALSGLKVFAIVTPVGPGILVLSSLNLGSRSLEYFDRAKRDKYTWELRSAVLTHSLRRERHRRASAFPGVLPSSNACRNAANSSDSGLRSGNCRVTLRKSQGYAASAMGCCNSSDMRSITCKLLIQVLMTAT